MSKSSLPKKNESSSPIEAANGLVHQLRQPRSELTQHENRFKLLVDTISDYAIFLLDPSGYIQSWNPGAQRFKGYTAQEAIGKHFSIFYTEEDTARSHPQEELQIASQAGKFEEEGWRIRKDGSRFWASVVITRLTDDKGNIVGFAKVTRDLTQRKMAEEELRLSEEKFRLLVSAVKDYAIFMLDPDGRINTWNEGAQRIKGYRPDEIIGQHFSKFYLPQDIRAKKPEWELEEAKMTGRFEEEGWRIRKDGTRFWADVVITAIRNESGTLIGFSKVTRDMTDRRRLEEKLRRANEDLEKRVEERTAQLQEAVRARDEFMSIISHELRTPITSLKLQVQTTLRQGKRSTPEVFSERAIRFVNGAERQLDRLSKLIDDMLDVSRISLEKLPLNFEILELGELIQETIGRFDEQVEASGSPITMCLHRGVRIKGDRIRLEQVFSNLFMNALKYGEGKPIMVSVGAVGDRATFTIQDQGMGIASTDQTRIFERFERAISASSVSGLGLGLYISRKIIETHHGRISVQSEMGKGATFTVALPLAQNS
jgi:PAS domain S-box-containing protein